MLLLSVFDILTIVVVIACVAMRHYWRCCRPDGPSSPAPHVCATQDFDLELALSKWCARARRAGFSDAVCAYARSTVTDMARDADVTAASGRTQFCDALRLWARTVGSRPGLFHTFMAVPEAAVGYVESAATDGCAPQLLDLPPELCPFACDASAMDVPILPCETSGVLVTHTQGAVSFFVRANPLSAFLSHVDFGGAADATMDREVAAFIVARILTPLAGDIKAHGAGIAAMVVHTRVTAFPTPELHIEVVMDRRCHHAESGGGDGAGGAMVTARVSSSSGLGGPGKRTEREKIHINMTVDDAVAVFTTIKDRLCTYAPLFMVGMYVLQDSPPWTFRLVLPPAHFGPSVFKGERRKTWMLHNMDASLMSPTLLEEAMCGVDGIRGRAPPPSRPKSDDVEK